MQSCCPGLPNRGLPHPSSAHPEAAIPVRLDPGVPALNINEDLPRRLALPQLHVDGDAVHYILIEAVWAARASRRCHKRGRASTTLLGPQSDEQATARAGNLAARALSDNDMHCSYDTPPGDESRCAAGSTTGWAGWAAPRQYQRAPPSLSSLKTHRVMSPVSHVGLWFA